MTVRINKQKINLREKLAGAEDKVNFDEVVRGLGEYGGNVGIGTTGTDFKLDVLSDEYKTAKFARSGSTPHLFFENTDDVAADGVQTDCAIFLASNLEFRLSRRAGDNIVQDQNVWLAGDSAGNVGIGTTNPGSVLEVQRNEVYTLTAEDLVTSVTKSTLRIKGSSNSSDSLFFGCEKTDANPYIQATNGIGTNSNKKLLLNPWGGNVGIGTANPDAKLLVLSEIENTYSNNVPNVADCVLGIANKPSNEAVNNHASLQFNLNAGTHNNVASISLVSESATLRRGALTFCTEGGAASRPEAMRIDSAGNVGIGTTIPNAKLDIETTSQTSDTILNLAWSHYNTAINIEQRISWSFGDDASISKPGETAYIAAGKQGQFNLQQERLSYLSFATENGIQQQQFGGIEPNYTPVERMRIAANGNVGIGTTSPGGLLHVAPKNNEDANEDPTNESYFKVFDNATSGLSQGRNGGVVAIDANYYLPTSDIFSVKGRGDNKLTIKGNGNVGIGTTDPGSYKLNVNGTARVASGDVTSDDRVKHNEQPIVGALETLSKVTPKKYIKTTEMYDADHDFELDADGNPIDENGEPVEHRVEAGVIAQQVLTVDELAFAVSPEGVDEDGAVTSPHGLDYNSLFTYAIAAIQEQQTIINDLKSRIETLEQQ